MRRKKEAPALPPLADISKLPAGKQDAIKALEQAWPVMGEREQGYFMGAVSAFAMMAENKERTI